MHHAGTGPAARRFLASWSPGETLESKSTTVCRLVRSPFTPDKLSTSRSSFAIRKRRESGTRLRWIYE